MIYYGIINLIIISSAFLFVLDKNGTNQQIKKLYINIVGVTLILFSGLRGDFTSDYRGYSSLFSYYNSFGFREVLLKTFGQEKGYVILNRFIGLFTDKVVFLMIITSFIVIVLYLKEIRKDSNCVWLSVLLFITIGQYYNSFNLIRQVIASGIIFSGSKYLYEKNFKKYLVIILIASLFHKTAIIMVVFYFILNIEFNFKQIALMVLSIVVFFSFTDQIMTYIQKYVYSHYTKGLYGMDGYSIKNAVLPIFIFIFTYLHKKHLRIKNDNKANVWINAVIFYTFFCVLGLKIQMLERMSSFFAPYVLLIVPHIIRGFNNKYLQILYILVIAFISIAYSYITLSGTGYDPYNFIWR